MKLKFRGKTLDGFHLVMDDADRNNIKAIIKRNAVAWSMNPDPKGYENHLDKTTNEIAEYLGAKNDN